MKNLKGNAAEQQLIVAAHRSNDIKKLTAAIDFGLKDFEVDIHIQVIDDAPILMIGHEIATATGQTFEEYMADLMSMRPDFHFLWLDMKDLASNENEAVTIETLHRLDSEYNIKDRVLVESRYIEYLTTLANEGWRVSYYCEWDRLSGKTPEEQAAICQEWLQSMQQRNVDGISFDVYSYIPIRDNFAGKTVNGRLVQQYAWDLSLSFSTPNLEEELVKYSHLSVLLITFSAVNLKKPIVDVQFDEGGLATNLGETIESLPEGGSVHKITTQYNNTYEKYEAVFDGSNFFYIPYTKEDIIGSTIKNRFTFELLFAPEGGQNPFASMENGGLGYEINETSGNNGELSFWYNMDNNYVLPGDSFKTPIQYGTNRYYHVFISSDGNVFKMYVDGRKIAETTISGTFTFPEQQEAPQLLLGIGADYYDSATQKFQGGFVGKIIHAKIHNSPLSDNEVQLLTEGAIPKLTMDVEFAEGGKATNLGQPVNSLPVGGSVHEIETQYNETYRKYEAVFDATNYFYVPYTEEDEVGRSIKSIFSAELLFTPDGGVNPFSSLEYGGLGFELENAETTSELSFWYNIGESYVLPGDEFKTQVQKAQNVYYHVFVTYDGNLFCMYVDGNKIAEYRVSGEFTFPRQSESPQLLFGIGADYFDKADYDFQNGFRGKIVHAKIYRGALSETAVKRITEESR